MAIYTHTLGWQIDTDQHAIRLSERNAWLSLPDVSLGTLALFGLNYITSQAAGRTVGDSFKRDWLAEARKVNPDTKASDAPKSAVPDPESPEYRERLAAARDASFDKLVAGYVYNAREGGADPYEEEMDKLARPWLQHFAIARKWFALPPKRKVAKDEDAYADPKGRFATFGHALAGFISSPADSKHFAMKGPDGKPWPIKVKPGVPLGQLLDEEVKRRVALRDSKPAGIASVEADDAVEF